MSTNKPRQRKCWARLCCFSDDTEAPDMPEQSSVQAPNPPTTPHRRDAEDTLKPISSSGRLAQTAAKNKENAHTAKAGEFDLWGKALQRLKESKEDRKIVTIIQGFGKNPAGDTAHGLAKDIMRKMEQEINDKEHNKEQRAWKIKIGQDEYSIRDFVDKSVGILNKFVAVGDVAVSFDPVHAALPWAAVRSVLVSLAANSELRSQIIFGVAKVTMLVLQCDVYRQLYIEPDSTLKPPKDVLNILETSIVNVYVKSLLFLGFAVQLQRSWSKRFSAPFSIADMEEYIKTLTDRESQLAQAAENCEKHCNYLHRARNEKLLQVVRESRQAIMDQHGLLLNIYQEFVLGKLPTAEGVGYDSYNNRHVKVCLPGTRVNLLAMVYEWVDDTNGKCIYWLRGMAGTGKSTISRTVACNLACRGALGASFFFKKGEGDRGKAARFFTSIASQLAQRRPSLAQHIRDAINNNPSIAEKALKEQFEKLILYPLKKFEVTPSSSKMIVIVVDALDECDHEEDIREIINILSQAISLTSVRLRFFITSRPELPIRLGFEDINGQYQDLILNEIPELIIEQDITTFLEFRLEQIRVDYNKSVKEERHLRSDWPGETRIKKVAKMAIPLFIFAATACLFIDQRKVGDPEKQLMKVLEYQASRDITGVGAIYLPILEQMVSELDRSKREVVICEFRDIVGSLVLLANPLSTASLSPLLGIDKSDIDNRLDLLHSVLDVPSNSDSPVKLLHLSFRDFLIDADKRKTNPFWVDEKVAHEKLMKKCIELLGSGHLNKNMCNLQTYGELREHVDRDVIDRCLPLEVQYACLYWVHHLKGSGVWLHDGHQAFEFLQRRFLHWLEALSLIGRISESIGLIDDLQGLIYHDNSTEISWFLRDAKRFILNYRSAIDLAPLQLYSSALIFTPERSIIRKTFRDFTSWINMKPTVELNWNPCLQTLEGHSDWVQSVAFSRNSRLVASGSRDGSIKIWDAATGAEVQTFQGHSDSVQSVAFSSDSRLVASGSMDRSIKIWDAATGAEVQTFQGHSGWVLSVAFSRNSRLVASGSNDRSIKIWDAATGAEVQTFQGHSDSVLSVAFSSDSRLVASGSMDGSIKIWDAATGAEVQTFQGHSDSVLSVAFSSDSRLVASGSMDGSIKIWDAATGAEVQTFQGHSGSVLSVAFSSDSRLVASGSMDRSIKIWDAATGAEVQTFQGHSGWVLSVVFSSDSRLVASGSNDGSIKIWDAATGAEVQTFQGHSGSVLSVAFSSDSRLVASGSMDGSIKIWDAATGAEVQTFQGHSDSVLSVAFSSDSRLVASGSMDRSIKIWDAATGAEVQTFQGHSGSVLSVAFSSDSRLVASGSVDRSIKIWDAATGAEVQTFQGHSDSVLSVAFSSDSRLVASGSRDRSIKIWDAATGAEVQTLQSHSRVYSISFDATSSYLLTDIGPMKLNPKIPISNGTKAFAKDKALIQPAVRQGYGLSSNREWISWNGNNVLWLPPDYRPSASTTSPLSVIIGCRSGRVFIINFSGPPIL